MDVFALGTLIYEIYSSEVPYYGLDPCDIKDKIMIDGSLPYTISIRKPILEISNFITICS